MANRCQFGPFVWDPDLRTLQREGVVVPLPPKLADTLGVLIEADGQLVEKAELIRRVWPDTQVEDVGLARNISLLRKALDDEGETLIATVPKRGYRLAMPVQRLTPKAEPPAVDMGRRRWPWIVAAVLVAAGFIYWQFYRPSRWLPGTRTATLVVLPFVGATNTFPEQLTGRLGSLPAVSVMSPSVIARYRAFGVPIPIMTRILGADVLLEGSMDKSASRWVVNARLADVRSGKLIWSATLDRPAMDPLILEGALADQIAEQVRPFLTAK